MSPDEQSSSGSPPREARRRSSVILILAAAAFVAVPSLFWLQTWFGRTLSDSEMEQYLHDNQHPHKIQHALSQIANRIVAKDPAVRKWYPGVVALAFHPEAPIRSTAAWVMGQDNTSDSFHAALMQLLHDRELLVRRNAALSLVRFQDASGRSELLDMLQPHVIRASASGKLSCRLTPGQNVGLGARLALIRLSSGEERDLRAPFSGEVVGLFARDGLLVTAGDPVVSVLAGQDQIWEALRGLYLVGRQEDLPGIEPFTRGREGMSPRLRQQAIFTAKAIRTREEQPTTH